MQFNVSEIKRKIKHFHANNTQRKPQGWKINKKHEFPFLVSQCLPLMIEECRNSSIVAVKSIRFYVDFAVQLQKEMPHLRVIHYSRDPRGIVNSRHTTSKAKNTSCIVHTAEHLCQFMMDNIESQNKYGIKPFIKQMKYEDLAANPINFTQEIYDFVGEEPLKILLERIDKHTTGGKYNGPIGTSRFNSSATSIAWKHSVPEKIQNTIMAKCSNVVTAFSYDL